MLYSVNDGLDREVLTCLVQEDRLEICRHIKGDGDGILRLALNIVDGKSMKLDSHGEGSVGVIE